MEMKPSHQLKPQQEFKYLRGLWEGSLIFRFFLNINDVFFGVVKLFRV